MEFVKEETTKDSLAEFSRAIISGQCPEHILETIEKFRSRFPPGQKRSIEAFPKLAGSHLKLDNPALFYAKTVMEMLSAHQEVEEEVRVLRRNLFRILNTSGTLFSNIFKNLCHLFRIFTICRVDRSEFEIDSA
jgi:DNA polymerase epsilon subunit 1